MARVGPLFRLSAAFVRTCATPGVYADGGGLRFRVMPNGSRLWVMRITVDGRRRDISLGPAATRSLMEAREQAARIRKAVADGHDPTDERRERRAARLAARQAAVVPERPTFDACWRSYWAVKEPQLSNGKHGDQWVATMKTYVLPHIGQRPVADVRPGEIIDLLKPIWHVKEETARRVLQRVDAVFVSAITRELRDKASPCTGVAKELGKRRRPERHHAALPYQEVAAFLEKLRQRQGPVASRLAFEFLVVTAARSGETRGAAWSEIDTTNRLWTIPAVAHEGPHCACRTALDTRTAYSRDRSCRPSGEHPLLSECPAPAVL